MVCINIGVREKNFWVFLTMFMFWSLLGAIVEHVFYAVGKKDGKRYMSNPVLTGFPLYGIIAYIVVFLHRMFIYKFSFVVQFFIYGVIISGLEYIIGKIVGAGPDHYHNGDGSIRWWNYSGKVLNFEGLVDLEHFLYYGVFGLVVSLIHPVVLERVNHAFSYKWSKKYGSAKECPVGVNRQVII